VIDLTTEASLPLAAAAKIVPPGRNGKRTHVSTLIRWITRGAPAPDGSCVRLEAVRLGSRWVTSREALARFTERLTPKFSEPTGKPANAPRSPASRRRASDRAAAELKKLGL
jgi:hypothetical protein